MTISYTFTQSSPALAWTIIHNLNCAPVCDVVENDGGVYRKVLPLSVKHIDNTTLLVEFTEPTAGVARLIGTYTLPAIVPPGSIDTGANSSGIAPQEGVGLFAARASSGEPPPLTVNLNDRTFVANAPGLFEFTDDFVTGSTIVGHVVDTWTPSPTYTVSNPYAWIDPDSQSISGGEAHLVPGALGANLITTDEYDMPDGMFLETRYNAASQNDTLVIGFNLGYTSISIVAGGMDGGYENHIRMDASGFNGAVAENGTLLPPTDNDTLIGIFSASFTLDRYYSQEAGDWRNKVLRLELNPTLLTLLVDGDIVMQQVPRFNVQLFASANFQYSAPSSNVTMFYSGSGAGVDVDYVNIGSLVAAPPPPPPNPTITFLDNFTGTGFLTAHTPDSATGFGSWTDFNGSVVVDGSGNLSIVGGIGEQAIINSTTQFGPSPTGYGVEFKFNLDASAVQVSVQGNPLSGLGYFQVIANKTSNTVTATWGSVSMTTGTLATVEDVVIRVNFGPSAQSIIVDGNTEATDTVDLTGSTTVDAPGTVSFYVDTAAAADNYARVDYLSIAPL